jgi:hypothetical protein
MRVDWERERRTFAVEVKRSLDDGRMDGWKGPLQD